MQPIDRLEHNADYSITNALIHVGESFYSAGLYPGLTGVNLVSFRDDRNSIREHFGAELGMLQ